MEVTGEDGDDLGGGFFEHGADGGAVLDARPGIERLVDEDEYWLRGLRQLALEPRELLRSDEALVALGRAAGIVAAQHQVAHRSGGEGIIRRGHSIERGRLRRRKAAIHVVVAEYVMARAGEAVPGSQKSLVARLRLAEVAEVDDEVGLRLGHRGGERADALDGVGHHVLVYVGDQPEAHASRRRRGVRGPRHECRRQRQLLQELSSGIGHFTPSSARRPSESEWRGW